MSRTPAPAFSTNGPKRSANEAAPGRLPERAPIAIVDIGSNSVRLVAYEGLTRSPTPIFNEKVLCALGRGVATTGKLNEEGVAKALAALRRFRVLCETMGATNISVLATAAARDASNGAAFLQEARAAIGAGIELLSGPREAELSALGVVSSIHEPDGVVGDLGGGSLELVDVRNGHLGPGISLQLGSLALMDLSGKSPKKAIKVVRDALKQAPPLDHLRGRTFYAVGGTWRSLARLHMAQRDFPLPVMHGYVIPARDVEEFARLVERVNSETLVAINMISSQRRPLLAYGAVVIEEIMRVAKPRSVVISAMGVREGLLYERLSAEERRLDPLLCMAREFNLLRSRAPRHGEDLCGWTDAFIDSAHFDETANEGRLRHAACLLSDIAWRAHPDYRGEQAMSLIANAAMIGVDHSDRAFLALAASYRHVSLDTAISPRIGILVSARMLDRARVLGAAMRVAYIVSAAMPDVLNRTPMRCQRSELVLTLAPELAALANDKLHNRLRQLARLIGREPKIIIAQG